MVNICNDFIEIIIAEQNTNKFIVDFQIVTTDSTTSEDEPPPLPVKTRESNDYSNLPLSPCSVSILDNMGNGSGNYSFVKLNKPLPAEPVTSYDYVDPLKLLENRRARPPTPPPKPSRGSKYVLIQHND